MVWISDKPSAPPIEIEAEDDADALLTAAEIGQKDPNCVGLAVREGARLVVVIPFQPAAKVSSN